MLCHQDNQDTLLLMRQIAELYHMEDAAKPITDHSEMTKMLFRRIIAAGNLKTVCRQYKIQSCRKQPRLLRQKTNQNNLVIPLQYKKPTEKRFVTKEVLQHTISTLESSNIKHASASKRIVVSEEESYLYFGRLIDGLRQGRGRTEMENGFYRL